jgi:nucleoside-diphosphate-sugar epimerase
MNVLITGALGWLGKALTEVVSNTHTVCAFDLETSDWPREEIDFDGEIIYGSVTDFDAVREAVRGQDAVIHAAVANTRSAKLYRPGNATPFLVNVQGTYNVLEAARQEGISRVVLVASAETHVDHPPGTYLDRSSPYLGLPGNVYDLTKHLQEEAALWFARQHGMEIIALRLGDILDLKRGLTKWDKNFWNQSMENGTWIDRYDVGRACLQALEIEHAGFDIFHLVGAPSASRKFDTASAESILGIHFTTEFDPRHVSER